MTRRLSIAVLALILAGCSATQLSFYEKGDLFTRQFLDFIPNKKVARGDYYEVRRNAAGQIVAAFHFSKNGIPVEKSHYEYDRKGLLHKHHYVEYFNTGLPRLSREWIYKKGKIVQREERWLTRSRTLEKKLTVFYDGEQKPYLEQTWGLGERFESSTEYYYDHKKRLDKSRRNFYDPDGNLRDYWLTIYNDDEQIMTEEHYLPDNSLITFYRYTYHPVKGYREQEEILDVDRDLFIVRKFDDYGRVQSEEEQDRHRNLKERRIYEYTKKHKPAFVYHYNARGKLIKKTPYQKPVYLKPFRTPGL